MEIVEHLPSVKSSVFKENAALRLGQISLEELESKFSPAPEYQCFYTTQEAINLCNNIVASGKPNFAGERA